MQPDQALGVSLAHTRHGTSSPTLVFVHGWMMAGAVFAPLVDRLEAHASCWVLDLRGCGDSPDPGNYTLEHFASDVLRFLEAHDLTDVTLVGHSMGGQVCQLAATTQPQRVQRLILVNPVPASGLPLPDEARALFSASPGDRGRQAVILEMATHLLTDAETERLLDVAATVRPDCIRQALDAWTAGGFAEQLHRVRCETHVVATSDPFLPAAFLKQEVVDRIEGAQLHELEGPGHYPANEVPEQLAQLVKGLL